MKLHPLYYPDAAAWTAAQAKRVLLFGMSGLGKTHASNMLRSKGHWFHYSIDYRIGTRYMGELIADSFKHEAMQVPYLRHLLMTDSIYIASNITFDNLAPLSMYLGKPGSAEKGGLPLATYRKRQAEHRSAEIAALQDTPRFIERAQALYAYDNFVCDSGGSICEVVNPEYADDPVLKTLAENLLMVWIEDTPDHMEELARRFDRAPKPMYYDPAFLNESWADYLADSNLAEDAVDPDAFVRWTYARALSHRHPRYAAMARNWGVSVTAEEIAVATTPEAFNQLIAKALERTT